MQTWIKGTMSAVDYYPLDAGDLDGDGTNDLIMMAHGTYGTFIHLGPFPMDGGAYWMDDDADAQWIAPIEVDYCWMSENAYGSDLDGDGRNDFLGSPGSGCDGPGPTAFDVFLGGTWGGSWTEPGIRVLTTETYTIDELDLLEDLDGDGIDEVRTNGGGWHFILSGADLPHADGQYIQDLAFARMPTNSGGAERTIFGEPWRTAGDWTGDGRAELFVVANISETLGFRHGEVFVFDGAGVAGDFSPDDAIGSWVGNVPEGGAGMGDSLDADGDGRAELILGDAAAYYLVPHVLPALRTPMSGLAFTEPDMWLVPNFTGDIDGDGYDDWAYSRFAFHPERTGHVWYGWDIPWNDPTAWISP